VEKILCPRCETEFEIKPPPPLEGVVAACPHCGWQFTAGHLRFIQQLAHDILEQNAREMGRGDPDWTPEMITEEPDEYVEDITDDLLTAPEIMALDPSLPWTRSSRAGTSTCLAPGT